VPARDRTAFRPQRQLRAFKTAQEQDHSSEAEDLFPIMNGREYPFDDWGKVFPATRGAALSLLFVRIPRYKCLLSNVFIDLA
jgi:hypothetical protein